MTKDEQFKINLLRMICAEQYFLSLLSASREMYGKSYFSLGVSEKQVLDQAVLNSIGGNYQSITPDFLEAPSQATTGFRPPDPEPSSS